MRPRCAVEVAMGTELRREGGSKVRSRCAAEVDSGAANVDSEAVKGERVGTK